MAPFVNKPEFILVGERVSCRSSTDFNVLLSGLQGWTWRDEHSAPFSWMSRVRQS